MKYDSRLVRLRLATHSDASKSPIPNLNRSTSDVTAVFIVRIIANNNRRYNWHHIRMRTHVAFYLSRPIDLKDETTTKPSRMVLACVRMASFRTPIVCRMESSRSNDCRGEGVEDYDYRIRMIHLNPFMSSIPRTPSTVSFSTQPLVAAFQWKS